jgi:hypothetical protein
LETNKSDSSFSVNQLIALNRFLNIYKGIGIAITILCLVLGITCITLANKNPIVVLASGNEFSYFQGRHSQVALNENNIKHFVEKFVTKYYNWNDLNPVLIYKNIEPLITDGLKENMLANLKIRKEKEFLGKKLQQAVTGISVQVTKESTIAIFDVVLRVDNIPLIVPTQVALQLVKGEQTEWNPVGLYVNNITTHEGR